MPVVLSSVMLNKDNLKQMNKVSKKLTFQASFFKEQVKYSIKAGEEPRKRKTGNLGNRRSDRGVRQWEFLGQCEGKNKKLQQYCQR